MLSHVENLLPRPRDSSEFIDYFFPWFAATTSFPTCDFETPLKGFRSSWKFFMQQLNQIPILDVNLDLGRAIYNKMYFQWQKYSSLNV